jgi:hypothetical protein
VAAHLALSVMEDGRPRRRWLAALGVALAYLCLVRPDQLAVALYLVLAMWIALSSRLPGRRGHRLAAAARRALWVLVPPLAVLVAWAGVNRATIGVTSVSTVLGFNMIDHVGAHVRAVPGPDYALTSAYLDTRRRTHAVYNVSYDALPALERASHLNAAHLSGRLLSIAEGVIERHPVAYVASSIKQWPSFWIPPNYAYEFATGQVRGPLRSLWQLERVVFVLINLVFVLLFVSDLAVRAAGRRRPLLSGRSLLLGAVAVIGMLTATFLAYGETGRYGYVYLPLVLSVTAASAGVAWQALTARAPRRWGRSHPSRI